MKKILILANNDVGLYNFRKELVEKLLGENEVYISLPYGKKVDFLKEMGCKFIETPVDRRGMNPLKDTHLFVNYIRLMRKINPDIVITYTIKPNIYGSLAARLYKSKYFVNITGLGTMFNSGNIKRWFVKALYKMSLKKAKSVFFENEENMNLFVDEKIIKYEQAVKMNGAGVNLQEFEFAKMPDCENKKFLFIGRLMKEKGLEEYLYAAEKIKKEFPETEFHIVGMPEEDYEKKIDELAKNGIIIFHGYQEDVRPFIKMCHCVVLPSYHEGMSNVLLESAAMGRVLITSDIPGCREAVAEGGKLVTIKDKNGLYKKINEFVCSDSEEIVMWGKNSRELMKNVFDRNIIIDAYMKEIKGIEEKKQ